MGLFSFLKNLFSKKEVKVEVTTEKKTESVIPEIVKVEEVKVEAKEVSKPVEKVTAKEIKAKVKKTEVKTEVAKPKKPKTEKEVTTEAKPKKTRSPRKKSE
jgi:hypothetical protein